MSDIVDIKELREQFQEKVKSKELKEFAHSQQLLIEQLCVQNQTLKDKLAHAESMMMQGNAFKIPMDAEELICIEQIALLKGKSASRELSLDEVKRLDILVKNLRLIRDQSTQVIDAKEYTDVREEDLVRIAQGSRPQE